MNNTDEDAEDLDDDELERHKEEEVARDEAEAVSPNIQIRIRSYQFLDRRTAPQTDDERRPACCEVGGKGKGGRGVCCDICLDSCELNSTLTMVLFSYGQGDDKQEMMQRMRPNKDKPVNEVSTISGGVEGRREGGRKMSELEFGGRWPFLPSYLGSPQLSCVRAE